MLDYDDSTDDIVALVLKATEKNPYISDDYFVHMWVDDGVLYIRLNKIVSVDCANYVLKSLYKTGRLKNQYILRSYEAIDKVFVIRVEGYEVRGIYSAGELIEFCLGYYEVQESKESQEPIATFNDLLGVC